MYVISLLGITVLALWPQTHEKQLTKVAKAGLPKAVMLQVYMKEPTIVIKLGKLEIYRSTTTTIRQYLGSGVFISPTGHILTCAHLFDSGDVVGITAKTYDDRIHSAELLYQDARKDLALIKIDEAIYPWARVENPYKLAVGQEVLAIGYPLGLEFSVTHGIISYLNRDFSYAYNVVQVDAFINPGNSGGPLFNLKGNLVGINSFIIHPRGAPGFTGCGFSVHPAQINEFLVKFKGLEKAVK